MPYATIDDVRSRIPAQLWAGVPDEQPSETDVRRWLEQLSGWVDSGLRWKYEVPITAADDLAVLTPIVADLAAARVWTVLAGSSEEYAKVGRDLERFAKDQLVWNRNTGRMLLVLPSTTLAEDGEAAVARPAGTFTDPCVNGNQRRLFRIGMKF